MKIVPTIIACACLLLLCSCVETPVIRPPDISINQDAGRGSVIVVDVRLKDGEDLPMIIDTGDPFTILDASLEPRLGMCSMTQLVWNFGDVRRLKFYAAPDLYLGNTLLAPADFVATMDCKPLSDAFGRPVMGILGLDILSSYCVQLDFSANKMRFLDDSGADKSEWGEPFHLSSERFQKISIKENLVGKKGPGSYIDTGCNGDGWLVPKLFQAWTNQVVLPTNGEARFPNGVLDGEIYSQLQLSQLYLNDRGSDPTLKKNGIGLHFLSQHLVTLDFPKNQLYLKRISTAPLPDELGFMDNTNTVLGYLRSLKGKGQLPGCSKEDHGELSLRALAPESESYVFKKIGDPSIYHYIVIRTSDNGHFKLKRAWQTNAKGKVVKEYPIQ